MKQKLKITAVLLLIVLVLGIFSVAEYERRRELVFAEALDEVILTVDQRELKLSELAFYVAYQEQQIEAAARIYNPDNTNEPARESYVFAGRGQAGGVRHGGAR